MSKFSKRAGVIALAMIPFAVPATAKTRCGPSVESGSRPKCVEVIVSDLAVRTKPGGGKVTCYFARGRTLNAPRSAGTKDGDLWYSVRLSKYGVRYFSERRNGRKTIRNC